jgi:hypothetical protein
MKSLSEGGRVSQAGPFHISASFVDVVMASVIKTLLLGVWAVVLDSFQSTQHSNTKSLLEI